MASPKTSKTLGKITTQTRYKKLVIVADNHGDLICPRTESKLWDVIADFKPEIRVHLGDFCDLAAWRGAATQEDKQISIASDVDAGLAFIEKFKPTYLTMGNHDYRMFAKAKSSSADTREYAEAQIKKCETMFKKLGTKTFAWGVKTGVLDLWGQRFLHGYSAGITATRTMGLKFGRCVHGHNHSGDIIWLDTYDGGYAQSVPSMADNDKMEYQRGQGAAFKHVSGFALAIIDTKTKRYYPGNVTRQGQDFVMMEPRVL
jgi:3',5'-cyclic AMP phosphodiesterase CpdA